jgi:hypothetical protein
MRPSSRPALLAFVVGALFLAPGAPLLPPVSGQGWDDLSTRERYRALQNYWRHERLPKERRRDVERRYQRWQEMSPEEREGIRRRYERFRQLSPREQRRVETEHRRRKNRGGEE